MGPRCMGERSVEDQDMSLEQDYGITIDYGTPGPILEPHQDEYIGQEEDTRIMESGQNLNREWEGNFHRAWTKSSERSRTRKSWNQDKTSIALVARHVDGRRSARARGVLEWKTRACTMQKEYIDQEQDTRTMESGQNLNRKDKGFPGHSDTRKSIFKYLKNC